MTIVFRAFNQNSSVIYQGLELKSCIIQAFFSFSGDEDITSLDRALDPTSQESIQSKPASINIGTVGLVPTTVDESYLFLFGD
jgi:hypothetical protein